MPWKRFKLMEKTSSKFAPLLSIDTSVPAPLSPPISPTSASSNAQGANIELPQAVINLLQAVVDGNLPEIEDIYQRNRGNEGFRKNFAIVLPEAFLRAVRFGHLEIGKWLKNILPQRPGDIKKLLEARDHSGYSAIELAERYDHPLIAEWLFDLEKNNEIALFKERLTPFLKAAMEGNLRSLEEIYRENRAALNERERITGKTALLIAASYGHIKVVDWLLDRGSKIEEQDEAERTALLLAASYGHTEVVNQLLDRGSKIGKQDKAKRTALLLAALFGHLPVVKLLINNGADRAARDASKSDALLLAARHGHLDIIICLIEDYEFNLVTNYQGRMQLCQNYAGNTPLALAVIGNHELVVGYLLKRLQQDRIIEYVLNHPNKSGKTVYQIAITNPRSANIIDTLRANRNIEQQEANELQKQLRKNILLPYESEGGIDEQIQQGVVIDEYANDNNTLAIDDAVASKSAVNLKVAFKLANLSSYRDLVIMTYNLLIDKEGNKQKYVRIKELFDLLVFEVKPRDRLTKLKAFFNGNDLFNIDKTLRQQLRGADRDAQLPQQLTQQLREVCKLNITKFKTYLSLHSLVAKTILLLLHRKYGVDKLNLVPGAIKNYLHALNPPGSHKASKKIAELQDLADGRYNRPFSPELAQEILDYITPTIGAPKTEAERIALVEKDIKDTAEEYKRKEQIRIEQRAPDDVKIEAYGTHVENWLIVIKKVEETKFDVENVEKLLSSIFDKIIEDYAVFFKKRFPVTKNLTDPAWQIECEYELACQLRDNQLFIPAIFYFSHIKNKITPNRFAHFLPRLEQKLNLRLDELTTQRHSLSQQINDLEQQLPKDPKLLRTPDKKTKELLARLKIASTQFENTLAPFEKIHYHLGVYFELIKEDPEKAQKYYLMGGTGPAKSALEKIEIKFFVKKNQEEEKEHKANIQKSRMLSTQNTNLRELQLKTQANQYGFDCHNVNKDGDCLFHAVAHQLRIPHDELRQRTAEHVLENLHFYKEFSEKNPNALMNEIITLGSWADDIDIRALSRALDITIAIIRSDGQDPTIFRRRNPIATIYLGYEVGVHYQSLVAKRAEEKGQKNIHYYINQAPVDDWQLKASSQIKIQSVIAAASSAQAHPSIEQKSPTSFKTSQPNAQSRPNSSAQAVASKSLALRASSGAIVAQASVSEIEKTEKQLIERGKQASEKLNQVNEELNQANETLKQLNIVAQSRPDSSAQAAASKNPALKAVSGATAAQASAAEIEKFKQLNEKAKQANEELKQANERRKQAEEKFKQVREEAVKQLNIACKKCDVNQINELLSANVPLNLADDEGNTPLINAYLGGDDSAFKVLVTNNYSSEFIRNQFTDAKIRQRVYRILMLTSSWPTHLKKQNFDTIRDILIRTGQPSFDQFQEAATLGNLEQLPSYLSMQLIPESLPPIICAAANGHTETVIFLWRNGRSAFDIKTGMQTVEGNTALHWALINGHEETAKWFVAQENIVNTVGANNKGQTPMHIAAEKGFDKIVWGLISAAVHKQSYPPAMQQDKREKIPLHYAAAKNRLTVINQLSKLKSYKEQLMVRDDGGKIPLMAAAWYGHLPACQKLLLDSQPEDINLKDKDGLHALTWAAFGGHLSLVQWMINETKVNCTLRGGNGDTALFRAIKEGHVNIVHALLNPKNVSVLIDIRDNQQNTALHVAAKSGQDGIAEYLLALVKGRAQINKINDRGETPLYIAASLGHTEIVQRLVREGANPSKISQAGDTPISIAAANGHLSTVQCLWTNASEEVKDDSSINYKLLLRATARGHLSVLDWLLDSEGANLAIEKNKGGHTIVYYAAFFNRHDVLGFLLDRDKERNNLTITEAEKLIKFEGKQKELNLLRGKDRYVLTDAQGQYIQEIELTQDQLQLAEEKRICVSVDESGLIAFVSAEDNINKLIEGAGMVTFHLDSGGFINIEGPEESNFKIKKLSFPGKKPVYLKHAANQEIINLEALSLVEFPVVDETSVQILKDWIQQARIINSQTAPREVRGSQPIHSSSSRLFAAEAKSPDVPPKNSSPDTIKWLIGTIPNK